MLASWNAGEIMGDMAELDGSGYTCSGEGPADWSYTPVLTVVHCGRRDCPACPMQAMVVHPLGKSRFKIAPDSVTVTLK